MTTEQREFHMEEYKRIGDVLEARIKDSTDLLKYVVLSAAAIVGWLTATEYQPPESLRTFAWAMPVAICILGMARDYGTGLQMETLQAYLGDMEEQFAGPALTGYQRFNHAEMEKRRSKKWRRMLMAATSIKWVYWLLTGGCFLFFILSFNQPPPEKKKPEVPCVPTITDAAKPKANGT